MDIELYKTKFSRTVFRVLNIVGIGFGLFFGAISLFQIEPLYTRWVEITPIIVGVAFAYWVISMMLNGLSMIDAAQKKSMIEACEGNEDEKEN